MVQAISGLLNSPKLNFLLLIFDHKYDINNFGRGLSRFGAQYRIWLFGNIEVVSYEYISIKKYPQISSTASFTKSDRNRCVMELNINTNCTQFSGPQFVFKPILTLFCGKVQNTIATRTNMYFFKLQERKSIGFLPIFLHLTFIANMGTRLWKKQISINHGRFRLQIHLRVILTSSHEVRK